MRDSSWAAVGSTTMELHSCIVRQRRLLAPVSLPVENHLNATGGATRFWRPDGRNPWVSFDEISGLPLDKFTVAVWVRLDRDFADLKTGILWELECGTSCATGCPFHYRLQPTPRQIRFNTVAAENVGLQACAPQSRQPRVINGVQKIADGQWHHVAVVMDTSTALHGLSDHDLKQGMLSGQYRLETYVDGELDGTIEGQAHVELLLGKTAS